ncbi:YetF domain-containing protein [uncultured Ferrovibrio sp.]|jgi:uncharacterized membrane protein YcaP (DUF421 family)|uniref:DUF421 domain-containing protein n=1 Tax=uncultured Ferrovibrio sp. TaxID=1576913 RepID=UPI00260E08A4|nr:YetF domain-containing protein [uncultured Ferrovibrio sp.]
MDIVLRAAAMYIFLLVVFRIAGRRTFSQMTSFDFVLLLVIGEATQQALLGDDFSVTNALIIIVSLIAIDIVFSLAKNRFPKLDRMVEGVPMIVVENGRVLKQRLERARISEDDVLEAARELWGLETLAQVKYAVLEANGHITVIPKEEWR